MFFFKFFCTKARKIMPVVIFGVMKKYLYSTVFRTAINISQYCKKNPNRPNILTTTISIFSDNSPFYRKIICIPYQQSSIYLFIQRFHIIIWYIYCFLKMFLHIFCMLHIYLPVLSLHYPIIKYFHQANPLSALHSNLSTYGLVCIKTCDCNNITDARNVLYPPCFRSRQLIPMWVICEARHAIPPLPLYPSTHLCKNFSRNSSTILLNNF